MRHYNVEFNKGGYSIRYLVGAKNRKEAAKRACFLFNGDHLVPESVKKDIVPERLIIQFVPKKDIYGRFVKEVSNL